jgi:hypothetical protein
MSGLGSTILEAILGAVCGVLHLCPYRVGAGQGGWTGHPGLPLPFYPFFWGWRNAGRLEMLDMMGFWTVITIFSMVFPALMADVSVTSVRMH